MNLLSELIKRRVFATVAIYIPAAWLAAEIMLAIFDRFDAPAWAGDIVVVLFLLGFPVSLLLSWLFDVTSEGVKRTSPGTPMGIVALLASGLFLSVGAYVSYQVFSGRLAEVRIAVLPFQTSELDEAATPYGAGVANDIRVALREIPLFNVPAQTSSEVVLRQGLDIPGIATRLGVEYVLEGSLAIIGGRLRVDVLLMDDRGTELWSELYEREVRDLFSLQKDLVLALSKELGLEESNPTLQAQLLEPPPTNDPEAHRLYLRGRLLPEDYDKPEEERERMHSFKAARLRDPGYAEVYAAIAREYAIECWILDDRKSSKCDLAIDFATEGLELDKNLAHAWAVLAMVHALRYEWHEAQDAIDHVYSLPDSDAIATLPAVFWNLGRMQEAWDTGMLEYRNDPLNPNVIFYMGAWAYNLVEDRDLSDWFVNLTRELQSGRNYGQWPDVDMHRVSMEQAIENARQGYAYFSDAVDWAPVIVPVVYGEAKPETAWPVIDQWLAEGKVRPASYWWMLAYTLRTDDFIELSFELFDDRTLNPAWMLMSMPIDEAVRTHPRFLELVEYIGYADYWDDVGWPQFCPLVNGERECGDGPSAVNKDGHSLLNHSAIYIVLTPFATS